jgi:hypothetical protein
MNASVNQDSVFQRHHFVTAVVVGALSLFSMFGCIGMPALPEQEQKILNNDLTLRKLQPRAFVRVWGQPTYQHTEYMPFFGMKDGSFVPRSRLAVGAAPPGWEADVRAGEGLFLAYPDRGWLVVFLDEELVYREELSAEKLHEIGRTWAYEEKFRTKIEKQTTPP